MISYETRPPGTFPAVAVWTSGRLEWRSWSTPFSTVVAHVRGRVVGVLLYSAKRDVLYVNVVWVDRAMRRRGIGRQMIALAGRKRIRAKAISQGGYALLSRAHGRQQAGVQDCRHRNGIVR